MHQRLLLLAGTGLALLLAACGKPAAEQPAPQLADATAPAAAPMPEAEPVSTDWPAVPSEADVAAAAAAAGMQPARETRARLDCANGDKLIVRFFPEQGVATLVEASGNTEMQAEPAASGLRYSGGGMILTGKGDDFTLDRGNGAVTDCRAV